MLPSYNISIKLTWFFLVLESPYQVEVKRLDGIRRDPPARRWTSTLAFSKLRNAILFNFFVKISSWVEISNLLFFVVFWTRRPLDPSRFWRGQAIFCYILTDGWSTSRCPMLTLSSAIERRARGFSFQLLRMLIGQLQLPQRAGRSSKSWRNTTCSNTITCIDNYTPLNIVYTVSRSLRVFYGGKRKGREP